MAVEMMIQVMYVMLMTLDFPLLEEKIPNRISLPEVNVFVSLFVLETAVKKKILWRAPGNFSADKHIGWRASGGNPQDSVMCPPRCNRGMSSTHARVLEHPLAHLLAPGLFLTKPFLNFRWYFGAARIGISLMHFTLFFKRPRIYFSKWIMQN